MTLAEIQRENEQAYITAAIAGLKERAEKAESKVSILRALADTYERAYIGARQQINLLVQVEHAERVLTWTWDGPDCPAEVHGDRLQATALCHALDAWESLQKKHS